MEESKDTLAYRFSEFAFNLNYDYVPKEVIDATKLYIMDWFGCALGGLGEASTQSILRVARELNGRADCTVIGAGDKMEPTMAAMVNGTMGHTIEMDDDHRTMCGHPGAPVIPAALAMSERMGLTGKQLIESTIAGYEMIIRAGTSFLGRAYYAGWHPTSTCGVFGATVSAAKALGLSAEQTATALGLAGSMSGGTLEYHFKGSYAKRFHPGNAARNGILAAMMARDGFTGPWKIFEGEWGWFNTHCEEVAELDDKGKPVLKRVYDASLLCDQLGERYDLLTNSFKVHCGGRFGATSIDAALEIVNKHDIKPEQVKEIKVGACDFTIQVHFTEGCYRPKNIVAAQFSLPFALALVLLRRKVGFLDFKEEKWRDSEFQEIMDKVTKYVDQEAEAAYPKHYVAIVTMILHDGTELKERVEYPKGDPENMPTKEELYEKFREVAGITLSKERVERLLEALINLEKVEKIGLLTELAVK